MNKILTAYARPKEIEADQAALRYGDPNLAMLIIFTILLKQMKKK